MQSPIEQEIIDGKVYWDTIGPDTWLRLVHRASFRVIGDVKAEYYSHGAWFDATVNHTDGRVTTECGSVSTAKNHVELYAAAMFRTGELEK